MLQKHKCVTGLLVERYKHKTTGSFKTPDDDQWRSKHLMYNVVLNNIKRLIVYI
jgi:hypothetical protein